MNSSGLFSALADILYQAEAGLSCRPSEETMSLTVFLAFCILGLDFMIYALFQWIYGDKRNALARQLAARKNALKEQSPRPFLVALQKATLGTQKLPHPVGERAARDRRETPRHGTPSRNDSPNPHCT
jgi:hypothetical protein